MSLPKKVQNLRRESMPYDIMKDAGITDILITDTVISGDIYIYHNNDGQFKLSHYENQGGNPVNYVLLRKKSDSPMFYTWEEVEHQIETRLLDGWDIRACGKLV